MGDPFFKPVSGMELPRFAGVSTFMRLPLVPPGHPRAAEVEIGIVGVPWDGGTSNRAGARHGPRALRDASTMIRAQHPVSGIRPFDMRRCADLGDVGPNPVDMNDTLTRVEAFFSSLSSHGTRPIMVGGDHLCTLPVLRGISHSRPMGLIHFDSHTDLFPPYFGGTALTHGNPFRVAVEEGLLDPARMIQIGIRGTLYDREDREFAEAHGVRIVTIEEFFARGVSDVMAEAREVVGAGKTYVSYDIDFVDPAFAPGTGTPEVGGPNSFQALEVVRGLAGVNIVAADLVEVSPPFDTGGITSWLGASVLFELLCVMA
jgi:guanidinopropionase